MFRDMFKIRKNSTYEELPFMKAVSCIFFVKEQCIQTLISELENYFLEILISVMKNLQNRNFFNIFETAE